VLIELGYLYEAGRILISATELKLKLEHEIAMRMCNLDFVSVAQMALHEKWTRDPFDRIIVAHAKANGLSPLISAEEEIRRQYRRTIW
jgi:PIN domain nuclease of toxin-antitoxin system